MVGARSARFTVRPGAVPVHFTTLLVLMATVLVSVRCGTEVPTTTDLTPTQLAFTAPPTAVAAGAVMAVVRAAVQDDAGNTVSASTAAITIAITSGTGSPGAALGGTLTRAAVNGVATFDDLTIDKVNPGYTLTVTATNLTSATSAAFGVDPGPASGLGLTAQPATATAGTPMILQVTVHDALGNIVGGSTAPVTVAIAPGTGVAGAVLGGTVTRAAVNGIATFDDLTIDRAGVGYRLTVTAENLGIATSNPFPVDPGGPSRIGLTGGPDSATAGFVMAPAVQAAVLDAQGNTVTTSTAAITLAITAGTGAANAVLSGTLTRAAVSGVATFSNLSIDQAGTGYTLTATATGLAPATTGPFDVTTWSGTPTLISLESDVGDYIGGGLTYQYTEADAVITASASGGRFSLSINGDEWWFADFQSPSSLTQLTPGTYPDLTRYPFHDPVKGGLSWSGEGRGCNTLTGWFAVDAVAYDRGALVEIDLRFEQHCEGGSPALRGTIHWDADDPTVPPGPVNPLPGGLWAPDAGSTPATGNYVYLESEPGDYIGQGQTYTYTPGNSTIGLSTLNRHLSVAVNGWYGDFEAMNTLTNLQVGYYGDLNRYPFNNPTKGGLDWGGQGRGCNRLRGWFAVDSVTYQGSLIMAIDLRFEQRCEGGTPALHGAIRWTR